MNLRIASRLLLRGQVGVQLMLAMLLALAIGLGLLPLSDFGSRGYFLQLALAAVAVMFWWLLAGARLLGFAWQARQLRMPRAMAHLRPCLLLGTCLTLLVPTLAWAAQGQDALLGFAALAAAACLGVLWISTPPWATFAVIAAGVLLQYLPMPTGFDADAMAPAHWLLALAIGAGALTAMLWARIFRNGPPAGEWSVPLGLSFGGVPVTHATTPRPGSGFVLALPHRIPDGLRGNPRGALSVALGPGLDRNLRAFAGEQLWILAVIAAWLLLYWGKPMEGGNLVALVFPAIILASQLTLPAIRAWALSRRPAHGLADLALLPGLTVPGEHRADTLVRTLATRQAMSLLTALVLLTGYGGLLDAPAVYHATLAGIGIVGAPLGLSLALFGLRGKIGGSWLVPVIGLYWIGALAMMMMVMSAPGRAWLWIVVVGCGVFSLLCVPAMRALSRQPHPYLAH